MKFKKIIFLLHKCCRRHFYMLTLEQLAFQEVCDVTLE